MFRSALVLACFFILGPLHGAGLPGTALSPATAGELGRIEGRMSVSLLGRRLLAQTTDVPRRELPGASGRDGLRFVGPQGLLAFDSSRLSQNTEWEMELILARELARASQAMPIVLLEGETAAAQAELEFALERALEDKAFDARLRGAVRRMEKRAEALRASDAWQRLRLPLEAQDLPVLDLPVSEFDRVAYYLLLFLRSPDEFYWAIERGQAWPPETVSLTELEDFLEKHHGDDLSSAQPGASGLYQRVGGRRYRPALVQAARATQQVGGIVFLHEALSAFSSGAIDSLRLKLNAWSRK